MINRQCFTATNEVADFIGEEDTYYVEEIWKSHVSVMFCSPYQTSLRHKMKFEFLLT